MSVGKVFQVARHFCLVLILVQMALQPLASTQHIDGETSTLDNNDNNNNIFEDLQSNEIDYVADHVDDASTSETTDYGLENNKVAVISLLPSKLAIESIDEAADDASIMRRDRRDHGQWHVRWLNWLRPITRAFMPMRGRKAYASSFVPVRGKKSALVRSKPSLRRGSLAHRRLPRQYLYAIRRLRGPSRLGFE